MHARRHAKQARCHACARLARAALRHEGGAWWRVYRHHLRLLRGTAIAWTVVLAGIGAGVVATFEDGQFTEAERAAGAALKGVPAFEPLFGRDVQPGALEGFVLSRWGLFAIVVSVWGLLVATKLLRGAEEAGHAEPLRAGALLVRPSWCVVDETGRRPGVQDRPLVSQATSASRPSLNSSSRRCGAFLRQVHHVLSVRCARALAAEPPPMVLGRFGLRFRKRIRSEKEDAMAPHFDTDLGLDLDDDGEAVQEALLERFGEWMIAGERSGVEWAVAEVLRFKAGYLDGRLGHWRRADLREILTEWFPRKVTTDEAGVAMVAPTLRAFFTWLDEVGLLDGDPCPALVSELDRIEAVLPALMADESRFGMAKTFVTAMLSDGVDIDDQEAIQRWTAAYNAALPGARLSRPTRPLMAAWEGETHGSVLAGETVGSAEQGLAELASLDVDDSAETMADKLAALLAGVGPGRMVEQFAAAVPAQEQPRVLEELWRVDDPDVPMVLDAVAGHASKPLAKAARRARFKHRTAAPGR